MSEEVKKRKLKKKKIGIVTFVREHEPLLGFVKPLFVSYGAWMSLHVLVHVGFFLFSLTHVKCLLSLELGQLPEKRGRFLEESEG